MFLRQRSKSEVNYSEFKKELENLLAPSQEEIAEIENTPSKLQKEIISFPNYFNPNELHLFPRTCEVNGWQRLQKIIQAALLTCQPRTIDEKGNIKVYESHDVRLRRHSDLLTFNVARKSDMVSFVNLMLQVAQHFVFEVMNELKETMPHVFSVIELHVKQCAKHAFDYFKKVHEIAIKYVNKQIYHKSVLEEMTSKDIKTGKQFILSLKRTYFERIAVMNAEIESLHLSRVLPPEKIEAFKYVYFTIYFTLLQLFFTMLLHNLDKSLPFSKPIYQTF